MVNQHALLLLLLRRPPLPPSAFLTLLGSPLMLVARSMAACWASALPDGTSPPLGTDDCSNRTHLSFGSRTLPKRCCSRRPQCSPHVPGDGGGDGGVRHLHLVRAP